MHLRVNMDQSDPEFKCFLIAYQIVSTIFDNKQDTEKYMKRYCEKAAELQIRYEKEHPDSKQETSDETSMATCNVHK